MLKVLEGDLERFSLPDLLHLFYAGRRDGALVLESEAAETKIFVESGRPVAAHSTKSEMRLGAVLERQGRIAGMRLRKALDRHDNSTLRLGQALLVEGALSEADLLAALKVQASSAMFDAFSWDGGAFAFYDGVPVPLKAVRVDLDFHSLLMEGVRRLDPGRTGPFLPETNQVLESTVNTDSLKQSAALTKEEWQVLFLVDGRRSIEDVCRLAGLPDGSEALSIVERLVLARFVRLAPPRPEEAAPAVVLEGIVGGVGTQGFGIQSKPADRVSVALGSGSFDVVIDDDRRHVVEAEAVQYGERVKKVMVSSLVLAKEGGAEASFPLNRDSYALGRHNNNDIVIADPKVSGFHARVDRTADGFTLVDLKSRNGTWLNGKRIDSATLKGGDEIRVGSARLTYRVDYESQA